MLIFASWIQDLDLVVVSLDLVVYEVDFFGFMVCWTMIGAEV